MGKMYQEREKFKAISENLIQKFVELSFPLEIAQKAIFATGGDFDAAIDFCCAQSVVLPSGWTLSYDRLGRAYFIDHVTRQTTYTPPILTQSQQALPTGWFQQTDQKGRAIYKNITTNKATYVRPVQ